MVYLTKKTTRGQHYYYLVKSFKYDRRVEKVQMYLGSEEPDENELEQLKQKHTIELELAAIERMALMSSETYRTPYLKKDEILGMERMRFLNRALNRIQDPGERAQEASLNSVQTISGNMSLSSNPLPTDNIEAIFEQDRAPSGVRTPRPNALPPRERCAWEPTPRTALAVPSASSPTGSPRRSRRPRPGRTDGSCGRQGRFRGSRSRESW